MAQQFTSYIDRNTHQLSSQDEVTLPLAAHSIVDADAIVVCTGAGMSVASGLATFRGQAAGCWPPMIGTDFRFEDMSCPDWFEKSSESKSVSDATDTTQFGYGFWQWRYKAYTQNPPHEGYHILLRWMQNKVFGGFSFTSNIDGAFRKIGWPEEQLHEVHGSLDFMQCVRNCTRNNMTNIWRSTDNEWNMTIDPNSGAIAKDQPLPACPHCNGRSRPNVMMFNDTTFDSRRESVQEKSFDDWIARAVSLRLKIAVIEIGAGVAIPTVRRMSEYIIRTLGIQHTSLLRINPEHPHIAAENLTGSLAPTFNNRLLSMTSDSLTILRRLDALIQQFKKQ